MEKKSIWTRDLLDNPFGHLLRAVVFPLLFMGIGVREIIVREAAWRRFTYRGFDAVCIGVGVICLGVICALAYNPWLLRLPESPRKATFILSGLLFAATFGTALFRNV